MSVERDRRFFSGCVFALMVAVVVAVLGACVDPSGADVQAAENRVKVAEYELRELEARIMADSLRRQLAR